MLCRFWPLVRHFALSEGRRWQEFGWEKVEELALSLNGNSINTGMLLKTTTIFIMASQSLKWFDQLIAGPSVSFPSLLFYPRSIPISSSGTFSTRPRTPRLSPSSLTFANNVPGNSFTIISRTTTSHQSITGPRHSLTTSRTIVRVRLRMGVGCKGQEPNLPIQGC